MVEAEQASAGVWPKVRSLVNPELDASSLAGLEKVCSSEEVCAIWECLRLAFPTKQVWEEVKKQFAKSLILMNGLPDDLVIKEIGRAWKFPEQEADPAYNRHVMGSLGSRRFLWTLFQGRSKGISGGLIEALKYASCRRTSAG